jgi:hypothetical protein
MKKTKTVTIPIELINDEIRREMFEIYKKYYQDRNYTDFNSDLKKSNHKNDFLDIEEIYLQKKYNDLDGFDDVLLIRELKSNKLIGFTLHKILKIKLEKKEYIIITNGDTVIEKEYWGKTDLNWKFFLYGWNLKQNYRQEIYWFLLSESYRTYLMMSKNFINYYPNNKNKKPSNIENKMIKYLSYYFGGKELVEKDGFCLIEYEKNDGKVNLEYAMIENIMKDDDIQYFKKLNPNYVNGDFLCCLSKFDLESFENFFKKNFYPSKL